MLLSILLFLSLQDSITGSRGNKQYDYLLCVDKCLKSCRYRDLDSHLRLLMWNCESNCKYICMMKITEQRQKHKQPIFQYFGKWPFKRYFGIQEPASVLFSIFNLFGVLFGWRKYMLSVPHSYQFYKVIHLQTTINALTWLSAAVYHTRDFHFTELLDYLGATAAISVSLFYCIARFVGKVSSYWVKGFGLTVLIFFLLHSWKLTKRLEYGYNMKIMLTLALANVLCWLWWCYKNYKRRKYVWKCAFLMIFTAMLAVFEVFDFPPMFSIFDGHSLWHVGTVPIAYFWYSFLIDDAKYELKKKDFTLTS